MIVVDTNMLMRSFNFVEQLGKIEWVRVVVPRAVYIEIRERANLDLLKKLKNQPQNCNLKQQEKTIILAMKTWPKLREKIQKREWLIIKVKNAGLITDLRREARIARLESISNTDLKVLAVAVILRDEGSKVKLLTLDRELAILARRMGIRVPRWHGARKYFWREEILNF
ncbi:MAG TPA: PIN domain-containing protein [Candidatus Paceibacterota bacterium]|nr:PIN domain-containing protein [Candidatus Paceibacterota bacterium]HQM35059.1 PIN domain-containing protein [Candidatus Paceibacterota bacterium]